MKQYKELDVLGSKIRIVYDDILAKGHHYGLFVYEKQLIVIDKNIKGDVLAHTLLHEAFHAVFERVGLNQTEITPELQEIIVENIATFLIENFDFK